MSCKKNGSIIIAISIQTETCQIHRKVSRSLLYRKKNIPKDMCGLTGDWQKINPLPDQIMCGQKYGQNWKSRSELRTTRIGKREAKDRKCSEAERDLLYRSWRPRLQRNSYNCEKKTGKTHGRCHALQKKLQMASRKCLHNRRLHPRRLRKQFMVVKWNPMHPQSNEWNLLSLKKNMKNTLTHYKFGAQIYSLATSDENWGCNSCSG